MFGYSRLFVNCPVPPNLNGLISHNIQYILNIMKPTEPQANFIERVGRYWESLSGSRTAGRILGWLMICEPDHQSSSDLVAALDVSTGSVSIQIRQLEQVNLVERITFPGDRASYYRLPDRAWSRLAESELDRMIEMRKLAEAGAELLPDSRPERVTELQAVGQFFTDEWPLLLDRLNGYLKRETL